MLISFSQLAHFQSSQVGWDIDFWDGPFLNKLYIQAWKGDYSHKQQQHSQ